MKAPVMAVGHVTESMFVMFFHCGHRVASAREARTTVPLCEPAAGGQRAPGAEGIGPGALHAQDAVSGWHDSHRARAAGSDGAPRCAGADAADALDPVSGADPTKPSTPRH